MQHNYEDKSKDKEEKNPTQTRQPLSLSKSAESFLAAAEIPLVCSLYK